MKIFFKVYDWKILAVILLTFVVLIFLPSGYIPDLLQLEKSITSGLFTRITISFISVFSFLVSVLILGYGFLREKFRRLTLREFLENRWISLLITVFISAFLVNIVSMIYLDTQKFSHNSLNVAYFSLSLSIIYFISFIPLALLAISSTDSLELLGKYIEKFELKHFPRYRTHELIITSDESNPIVVVNSLARSFAEKDDFHSINAILFSTQKRIQDLIGESKDRVKIGRLLTGQKILWDTIVHKAFQKKEFAVINNVFLAISFYHSHFADKKIPLLYLEEIRFFIHSLIERLVEENIHSVAEDALMTFQKIIENHYEKSVPQEEELSELIYFFEKTDKNYNKAYGNPGADDERMDANLQWQQIYSDLPYVFSIAIRKAIEKKNRVIFDAALHSINHLIHACYLSNMSEYQKAWITRMESGSFYHYQLEAIETKLIMKDIEIQSAESFVLDRMIDSNCLSKKYIFISTADFMVELFKLGRLDLRSFTFIGQIGRHCANNYDLEGAKQAFENILKLVQHFKKLFESKLDENSKNYLALKEEVQSFIDFHRRKPYRSARIHEVEGENDHTNNELLGRLKNILSEFKETTINEAELKIEWE
jgi:hypothetical protein